MEFSSRTGIRLEWFVFALLSVTTSLRLANGRLIQVGDDWRQDLGINFGGVQRYLVQTGKYRAEDELLFEKETDSRADWVGADFAALVEKLLSNKG